MPPWLWVLLAVVVLALAVGIPLLARRRRHNRWQADLAMARDEVAWTCRDLVPQLARSRSWQAAAGGWVVSSGRVLAAEDRLTELQVSAPDDAGRRQAVTLRDALHAARVRLDRLASSSGRDETLAGELDTVVVILEMALRGTEHTT